MISETICNLIFDSNKNFDKQIKFDKKIDSIMTNKYFAMPIIFMNLMIIFWITIVGANFFSDALSNLFSYVEYHLNELFYFFNMPDFFRDMFVEGLFRTLAWIISVMLPPMAIFSPMFMLLEDIKNNLDYLFKKAKAHGKQALSICMGFGCNAAGVISCRIIDSPKDKLIAILTNNFTPCNGRFPGLIMLAGFIFAGQKFYTLKVTLAIIFAITFSFVITLLISRILSSTILDSYPSNFMLEMPPYRKPKFLRIITRSIFDKTIYVLAGSTTADVIDAGATASCALISFWSNCGVIRLWIIAIFSSSVKGGLTWVISSKASAKDGGLETAFRATG